MQSTTTSQGPHGPHRPRALTVFGAAFVAGAAAAFGVNRVLDVHLAQAKPQVESEPIFVALRSLPQGAPVTVWDVALRDWPRAMLPTSALRADDSFDGCVLRHPLREGQPLLSVQLVRSSSATATADAGTAAPYVPPTPASAPAEQDGWLPGDTAVAPPAVPTTPAATLPPEDAIALELLNIASPEPLPPVSQPRTETAAAPQAVAETVVPAVPVPVESAPPVEPAAATSVAADVEGGSTDAVVAEPVAVAATPVGDVAVVEPEPVVTDVVAVAEPTPAPGAVISPPSEPAPTESVLGHEPVRVADATPQRPAAQHLVVPERIARQADTSFIDRELPGSVEPIVDEPAIEQTPPQEEPALRPVTEPQPQPVAESRPATVRPTTPPKQTPRQGTKSATRQTTTAKKPQRQGQTAPATKKPASSRQPAPASRGLGGFLPNFGSIVPGFGSPSRPAPRVDEAVATDEPSAKRSHTR